MLNTLIYTVGTYLPALVLALVLAQGLRQRLPAFGFARLLYFLPVATSWVAVSVVWRLVLQPFRPAQPDLRPRRRLADQLGRGPLGTGDHEHLEGDRLLPDPVPGRPGPLCRRTSSRPPAWDGANAWQRFRLITLPLLKPITAVCSVIAVIRGFQSFSPQVVLTGGGFDTEVVNLFVYKTAFESARMGRASAVAVLMFGLLLVVTLVQLRGFRRTDT